MGQSAIDANTRDGLVKLVEDGNPLSSFGEIEATVDAVLAAGWRPTVRHGTQSAYDYHRCRCAICREGHRDRRRGQRARKSSGSRAVAS